MIKILFGEEPYIIDKRIAEIVKKISCPEMNLHYFDSVCEGMKELIETLPVLDDVRVIILSLDELKSDEKLIEIIKNVPETTDFIIEAKKVDRNSKIYKLAKTNNYLQECNKLTDIQLKKFVFDILTHKGAKITNNAYAKMVERMGYFQDANVSLYTVEIFVRQLSFLTSIITDEDISKVIPQTSNEKIFELTKALISGNESACFSLALDFIDRGENVIAMLSSMLRYFRLGFKASLFKDYKKSELGALLGAPVYQYEGALAISEDALNCILDTIQEAINGIKTGKCEADNMFLLALGKINSILFPSNVAHAAR